MPAAIITFPSRAELARRAQTAEAARWQVEADQAHHMAQGAVAALLAPLAGDGEGVALRSALHGILARMAERGDFTTQAEALTEVEETLATILPGRLIVPAEGGSGAACARSVPVAPGTAQKEGR